MNQVYCGHKNISNDDMDFDDSKVLMIAKFSNDKRYFQMGVMTLIIQKPTVIPSFLMVLFTSTLLT